MIADRDWVKRNVGFDPISDPPTDARSMPARSGLQYIDALAAGSIAPVDVQVKRRTATCA